MKRLKAPTGEISDKKSKDGDSLDRIVRRAVLVHSGPNGSPIHYYTGDYDAETDPPEGDVFFDDARIKSIEKNHNEKINILAKGYGGIEQMPDGAFPALLDQHEDGSIMDVIGRLASLVKYEVMDVPGVGENCSCLTADLTFLGKDIVERANDGRIFHLSIGIDEETDTLGELSAVITPAAPGARLLKKGDKQMSLKKLEAHKKKLSTLKAIRENLSGMTKKVVAANEKVKLAAKQGVVTHRLTSLVRGGKITPAEFKKMNVKELAGLPDAQINTMMNAFEAMEPKILAGQRGTTAALDFASIGKGLERKQMSKLKAEIKGDFKKLGKKLKSDDGEDDAETSEHKEKIEDKNHEMAGKEEMPSEHMAKHMEAMKQMKAHMEAGDMKSALACHAAAMKHLEESKGGESEIEKKELELGDVKSEDYKKSSDELQSQVDELNTQIARIAGMVEELMTEEEAEGHELSEGFADESSKKLAEEEAEKKKLADKEEADKKLAADKEEEEKKKLAADKEEEEKKKLAKEEDDKKKMASEEKEKEKLKKELTGKTKKK